MRPATAAARAAPLSPRGPSSSIGKRSLGLSPTTIPIPCPFDSSSRSIPSSFSPPPKLMALTPLRRGMGFEISTLPVPFDLVRPNPNHPRLVPFLVEPLREKLKKLIPAGGGTPLTACFDESLALV